jgi:hypothetical protein
VRGADCAVRGAIARERKERDEMRVRFRFSTSRRWGWPRSRIGELRNRDRKIIIKGLKYERVTKRARPNSYSAQFLYESG